MEEPLRLPDEIRATLPPVAAAYLTALEAAVQTRTTANAALSARVAELEAQLGQTWSTSSRPPSRDPPGARPLAAPGRGQRRRGGPRGHPGRFRALLPVAHGDAVVRIVPEACAAGGAARPTQAPPDAPPAQRHQVVDLPPVPATVTAYRVAARAGRGW